MTLKNQQEVRATLEKIRLLEARYASLQQAPAADPHVRELSLCSLKRTVNQMREEVVRFETRVAASRDAV